jgi:MFS family permease
MGLTTPFAISAADAHTPARRARAISIVVFAGTIGAILGPKLVGPSSNVLGSFGFSPLAGPMWSGVLLFALAGALIAALLRPDPRDIGRAIAAAHPDTQQSGRPARSAREIMHLPQAKLALAAIVTAQTVMVLIMGVTSLHMHHHDHSLDAVGMVLMAHTLGMFGLAIVVGPLTDRLGRGRMIALGAALLVAGSVLAPVSLATPWLAAALFLIGLGWNACYIAGSSLLADILAPAERGSVQGATELIVNGAAATSSLASGVILAQFGYGALSMLGAALALLPLALLVWQRIAPTPAAPPAHRPDPGARAG